PRSRAAATRTSTSTRMSMPRGRSTTCSAAHAAGRAAELRLLRGPAARLVPSGPTSIELGLGLARPYLRQPAREHRVASLGQKLAADRGSDSGVRRRTVELS